MAGGRLEEILAELVNAGHSQEHISRILYADHRIEVSRQTIMRWIGLLGLEPNGDPTPETRAS